MEREAYVVAERFPYEEPDNTQLRVDASNGAYSGTISIYCPVGLIGELGRSIAAFPKKIPDEYVLEYGSEDPAARWAYYFRLRAYTIGLRGRSALQFVMNLNDTAPSQGRAEFSIAEIEPEQIKRLGQLFIRLASQTSARFRWTTADDDFSLTDSSGAT
jgi:hypothetical protein